MLKDADFCRCGNSLKVIRNCPTMACAGTMTRRQTIRVHGGVNSPGVNLYRPPRSGWPEQGTEDVLGLGACDGY